MPVNPIPYNREYLAKLESQAKMQIAVSQPSCNQEINQGHQNEQNCED